MSENDFPPLDPPVTPPNPPRFAGWLRVLFFGSLALNLLVVGLVVGFVVLKGPPDRDGSPRLRDAGLGPLGAILTSDQRGQLRNELKAHSGDLRKNRNEMRRDLKKLIETLRSDTFSPEIAAEILKGQRDTVSKRHEIGHRVLLDAVSVATAEERAEMADRIERALSRSNRRAPPPEKK